MKTYNDTKADAIQAAIDSADDTFKTSDITSAIPDACREYCWMVVNFTQKAAIVIWLNDVDEFGANFEMCFDYPDHDDWVETCREFMNKGGELPKGAKLPDAAYA